MTRYILAAMVLMTGCAEGVAPKTVDAARWEMLSQDANEGEESTRLVAVCRSHEDCSNRVEMSNLEQAEIGGSLVFYVSGDKTP